MLRSVFPTQDEPIMLAFSPLITHPRETNPRIFPDLSMAGMTCRIRPLPPQKENEHLSFLKHVNGGLIFVNTPILKFVNGAQKPHLRCADSLPTIRFPAVYLPFLKNQWKITWISRSVCE